MARDHSGLLKRLRHSEAGNIFPLTAAAIFVMAGLIGGGVDASRAYLVQNRLQNACDAGVLAGRKNVSTNGFDAKALSAARSYFSVNMAGQSGIVVPTFTPTTPDNGNTIEASVSTSVDTTLMRIFGYDTLPVSVSCTASMSMGNADVMMVLDTTGSMLWNVAGTKTKDVPASEQRITFLRASMMDFYDTIAASAEGTNARIRYGFVPYSSSVNVGHLLQPDWIVDEMDLESREADYDYETEEKIVGYEPPVYSADSGITEIERGRWEDYSDKEYKKEKDCDNDRPADQSWRNVGGQRTETIEYTNAAQQLVKSVRDYQVQRRTVYRCNFSKGRYRIEKRDEERELFEEELETRDPIFEEVETKKWKRWIYRENDSLDVRKYKLFETVIRDNGEKGADVPYKWKGCIEERDTDSRSSFSFSSLTGMTPYTWDLDIDTPPNGSAESKWRPMWPEMAYFRAEIRDDRAYYSPELVRYDGLKSNTYCPSKAQLLQSMNRDSFKGQADALSPEGSTYLDLGILWGGRLLSPTGMFSSNVLEVPQNGAEVSRHIVFLTDGEMQPSSFIYSSYGHEFYDKRVTENGQSYIRSRHTSRFRAVCEAVKAKGIRLWVIAFGADLNADLQACASNESSFQASDSDQLNEAFQEIAKNVGELRITL